MGDAVIQIPASRNTDPLSSHLAEDEVNTSGARKRQQDIVLDLVKQWPGSTSAELAHKSGYDRTMVARRLPELAGLYIRRGELDRCNVTDKRCVTWWPIQ